jgi:hypothetical protein
MRKNVSLREALSDPKLLGDALPGHSWAAWRTILIAAMGEELTPDERAVFARLTGGRECEPLEPVEILLIVAGRRSGKSRALSVLATYLSCLCDWSEHLYIGEVGTALYQAPTQRQASQALRYATDLIDHVDLLKQTVENRTSDCLTLRRSIELTAQAANWRYSRGSTCICCVLDETAFFHNAEDSANSDEELLTALMPSLSTTSGPMLIASSPKDMQGIVYQLHKKHFGKDGDPKILVVQAASRELNPLLKESVVARAYQTDPTAADAEYGGQFREPLTAYLSRELIERAVEPGITERPPLPGVQYVAFVDCSSGAGTDSFACAIGHKARDKERDVVVIDTIIAQKPPFSPLDVIAALAEHLKRWRIHEVMGDGYGKPFISIFAKSAISYVTTPLDTSAIYLHALPAWTSNSVAMLANPLAIDQTANLRRKIGQGGRETVDHPRGAHDDLANVVAGVIYRLTPIEQTMGDFGGFGVVTQPRIYPGDSAQTDTWAAWSATQNRSPFYAPQPGERSVHHNAPRSVGNALW